MDTNGPINKSYTLSLQGFYAKSHGILCKIPWDFMTYYFYLKITIY